MRNNLSNGKKEKISLGHARMKVDISLRSSVVFCGNTLGTGVSVSSLKTSGYIPSLMDEFISLFSWILMCVAKSLIIFGGMSSLGVDLLVFNCFNSVSTEVTLMTGISSVLK